MRGRFFGRTALSSSDLVLRRLDAASKGESRFRGNPRGLRASESKRMQFAWGSAVGAALVMAGCAGPTVQPSQSSNGSLTSIDGATVSLAAFEKSGLPPSATITHFLKKRKKREDS